MANFHGKKSFASVSKVKGHEFNGLSVKIIVLVGIYNGLGFFLAVLGFFCHASRLWVM